MRPPRRPECAPPETFPAIIENRPALDRISYRIGTYADARRWLLRRIDEDPTFALWTYRGADDPGIALYESAAILIDLLTLYQDAYANEAYLRTATWHESVADLVRLLGYRLKPGVGGIGTFAFEVSGTAPVAIPAELPLKVDLTEVPDTANFQTSAPAIALPWLSRFTLVRPQAPRRIVQGTDTLVIADARGQTFAEDDRVLVGAVSGGDASDPRALDPWEIAIVESVSTWHGRTVLKLEGGLRKLHGSHQTLVVCKLGRTFRHFGHDAPAQRIVVQADGTTKAHNVSYSRTFEEERFDGGEGAGGFPWLARTEVPLDPAIDDLALGTRLAIQLTFHSLIGWKFGYTPSARLVIGRVLDARTVTSRYGALSAPATIAKLDSISGKPPVRVPVRPIAPVRPVVSALPRIAARPLAPTLHGPIVVQPLRDWADIREIQIDSIVGEPVVVGGGWQDLPATRGAQLAWWGDPQRARDLLHRTIAIVPAGKPAYSAVVVDVEPTLTPDLTMITLDRDVPYADFADDAGTVVLGNLVEGTEGKQEAEQVLGNGDDRATFQTFEVPKNPLTYLHRAALSPPERPESEIVVGDRIWTYVPSLFGHGPDEEIYVVRQDNEGRSWVQFGDGKTGARLPSGVENVKIRFRTGSGAFGPSKPGADVNPGQRIDAITAISLPGVISGGSAPESAEVARVAAPLRVQSLDRLVSLADIEAETLSISGVERARAAWTVDQGLPLVQVTVLMQPKRNAELDEVRKILATANRARGPQRFPIQVVAGSFEYVYLDVAVVIDPTFEPAAIDAAAREALGVSDAAGNGGKGLFGSASRRSFGDAEYATRVEGVLQNVRGVKWVTVNAFGSLGAADDPAQLRFPTTPARADVLSCAATRVLRLYHAGAGGPLVLRISPSGGSA